jgi:hypothetical protein
VITLKTKKNGNDELGRNSITSTPRTEARARSHDACHPTDAIEVVSHHQRNPSSFINITQPASRRQGIA